MPANPWKGLELGELILLSFFLQFLLGSFLRSHGAARLRGIHMIQEKGKGVAYFELFLFVLKLLRWLRLRAVTPLTRAEREGSRLDGCTPGRPVRRVEVGVKRILQSASILE